jgi:hypothetical protein
MRKVLGVIALLMGVILAGWIVVNLVGGPTPATEGRNPLPAIIFCAALIGCGLYWLRK